MEDRQQYINAIKSSFIRLAKERVMTYLISQAAFISWPIVGPIVAMLVEKILDIAVNAVETGIFFAYVDFRTANQSKLFSDAAMKNHIAQQTGTAKEKENAEKELIDTFNIFIKFNKY